MHMRRHAFDDIEAKGTTRNFNTKPNESYHGFLRELYLRRTNFKDVPAQVRIPHLCLYKVPHHTA
jgi:hypothetical protein